MDQLGSSSFSLYPRTIDLSGRSPLLGVSGDSGVSSTLNPYGGASDTLSLSAFGLRSLNGGDFNSMRAENAFLQTPLMKNSIPMPAAEMKPAQPQKSANSVFTDAMLEGTKEANSEKEIPDFGKKPTKEQLNQQLDAAAEKYGIPPKILKAVAWKESTWNPKAKSFDGQHGKGVMQIDDRSHKFAKTDAVWDPKKNIDYGSKYLSELYEKTGSWDAALKKYNGGSKYPGRVAKIAGDEPWTEHIK